jgi:hypothetical protein
MASKPGGRIAPGTKARRAGVPSAGGLPACCPGGARCRGGVISLQALARNRRTCRPDSVGQVPRAIEREIAADLNAGQSVYYNVIPQYGTNTTAPNPQIAPYMPTSVDIIWGTQGIPLQGETLDNIP